MNLVLHQRMVRVSDGMKGEVVKDANGYLRIMFRDRGSPCLAPLAEEWGHAEIPVLALRDEEKRLVAQAADGKLRALMKHEPDRFWESPADEPFDPGLFQAIMEYLSR